MPLPSPRPLLARAAGKWRRAPLRDRAAEVVELSPAIASDRPPAIALPGEFDRARGFFTSRDHDRGRIEGGRRVEGATIAYRLDDAVLAGGTVYAGLGYDAIRPDAARLLLRGVPERIAEAALTSHACAESFFGDWLIEGLSMELLAADRGWRALAPARTPWLHEPGYRALTGLDVHRTAYARIDRLWLFDDLGINDDRRRRLLELRRRIRAATPAPDDASRGAPALVYLTRGRLGQARALRNDAAVETALMSRGFRVVHPEAEAPADLARLLGRARAVVCLEGSAQQHAVVAAPPGAALTVIQPPHRFTAPGKDLADLAGLRYAYLVGEPEEDGFSVDLARLHATLDLIGA